MDANSFLSKLHIHKEVIVRPSSKESKVSLYDSRSDDIYEFEGEICKLILQFQSVNTFEEAVIKTNPQWLSSESSVEELRELLDFLLSKDILEKRK